MKFQPRHLLKVFLITAVALSAMGIVAAQSPIPNDPCQLSNRISSEQGCQTPTPPTPTEPTPTEPTPTEPIPTPTPYDPCAPNKISAMGGGCNTPVPPVDPCASTSISALMISCATPTPAPTEEPETPVVPVAATPVPVVNYEENVSFNDTDLGVTLLKSEDANGNPQMELFHTNTGTNTTTYLFSITQETIAPFVAEHPTENTLLASAEGVFVYVLTTGEIQVNAGPDAEGKIHVKIFNGIPWTTVYGYTIDPQ